MAELIVPDKSKHKYVVGIDFGHGETSAAICKIEWNKDAGQREMTAQDIKLDKKVRVITSAICYAHEKCYIGGTAFEHMNDNNGIRIGFKQKPESLSGSAEKLMIDYMHTVYGRICESRDELEEDNHIVYIARPSGWIEEETKELYRQMAIQAGIPLGGLTSESRAAIFYAKNPVFNFAKEISKGAIVFDLGSSTLDFTYLSDTNQPIDHGYNLGASIIDEAILNEMILSNPKNPKVKEFVEKYPTYRDVLKFIARKFKEKAYSRDPESRTIENYSLAQYISENEESYVEYEDLFIPFKIKNLAELNEKVNSSTHYIKRLGEALDDFKLTKIAGMTVNGVFLTGGASRMNFIRPLIAEHLNISEDKIKIDNNNPSLTISRGIALLGTADAITPTLVLELKKSLPSLINNETLMMTFVKELASNIATEAWKEVELSCTEWINNGSTTDTDELKEILSTHMKNFENDKVSCIVNKTLQIFLKDNSENIRKEMNAIISRYAPGREIASIGDVQIGDIKAINDSLENLSSTIAKICDSITSVVKDILWAALGLFLFGLFSVGYYVIKGIINLFTEDWEKRKDKADKLLKKKSDVISDVQTKIVSELECNSSFKNTVSSSLNDYFVKLIDNNLKQVMIPIE